MSIIRHFLLDTSLTIDSLARELAGREDLALFAEYRDLRDKGLRVRAFLVLQDFVDRLHAMPVADRRRIACELAELHVKYRFETSFMPRPLTDVLTDIFRHWCDESPADPATFRRLGLITGESTHFETALTIDPEDDVSMSELAAIKLDLVDHATHHLGHSKFLGSVDDAELDLADASHLAFRIPNALFRMRFEALIAHYEAILKAWRSYELVDPDLPFWQWFELHRTEFET